MNDADIHRQFEGLANGDDQVGELPEWLHVRGKCAWYVYQGPFSGLGDAWQTSWVRSIRRGSRARALREISTCAIRASIGRTKARR